MKESRGEVNEIKVLCRKILELNFVRFFSNEYEKRHRKNMIKRRQSLYEVGF